MDKKILYFGLALSLLGCQEPQPKKVNPPPIALDSNLSSLPTTRNLLVEVLAHNPEDSIFLRKGTYEKRAVTAIAGQLPPSLFQAFRVLISHRGDLPRRASFLILITDPSVPSNIMRIREDSIDAHSGALEGDDLNLQIVDIDYDGYSDLILSLASTVSGGYTNNHCYLYDPKSAQFVQDDHVLTDFGRQAIFVNTDDRQITVGGPTGWNTHSFQYFRWKDGAYSLWAKEYSEVTDDGNYLIETREELINGEWKVVSSDTSSAN